MTDFRWPFEVGNDAAALGVAADWFCAHWLYGHEAVVRGLIGWVPVPRLTMGVGEDVGTAHRRGCAPALTRMRVGRPVARTVTLWRSASYHQIVTFVRRRHGFNPSAVYGSRDREAVRYGTRHERGRRG